MSIRAPDRTGVMVVRLWLEASHETGLRARITRTVDAEVTEQKIAAAASSDAICAVVKEWVEEFSTHGWGSNGAATSED